MHLVHILPPPLKGLSLSLGRVFSLFCRAPRDKKTQYAAAPRFGLRPIRAAKSLVNPRHSIKKCTSKYFSVLLNSFLGRLLVNLIHHFWRCLLNLNASIFSFPCPVQNTPSSKIFDFLNRKGKLCVQVRHVGVAIYM